PVPWGLRRMAPYPAVAPSYARVELDPATQTGRYLDAAGQVMEMPGHGTSTGTRPATNTGNPSDGSGPGRSRRRDPDPRNDTGPVLVVTNLDDPTTDLVIDELHRRGVPVVRFDSGDFPGTLSFAATLTAHGIEGTLTTPTRTADLSRVRSLYYRRPSGFSFP